MTDLDLTSSPAGPLLDSASALNVDAESPAALTPSAGRAPVDQPLAATIAPELLMKIFEATDDLFDYPWTKQASRLLLAKVCRS